MSIIDPETPLIITVGSNLLPVVVTLRALGSRDVCLVSTKQVAKVVERIRETLLGSSVISVTEVIIDEPNALAVRQALERRFPKQGPGLSGHALAYTAGTKLMSVHTHVFWRERGGQPGRGCYLGADAWLRFDDGSACDLRSQRLSLAELCKLHFGRDPKASSDFAAPSDLRSLASAIRDAVARDRIKKYHDGLPMTLYGKGKMRGLNKLRVESEADISFQASNEKNFGDDKGFATCIFDFPGFSFTSLDGLANSSQVSAKSRAANGPRAAAMRQSSYGANCWKSGSPMS